MIRVSVYQMQSTFHLLSPWEPAANLSPREVLDLKKISRVVFYDSANMFVCSSDIQRNKSKKPAQRKDYLCVKRQRHVVISLDWGAASESEARRGLQPTSSLTNRQDDPRRHRHILSSTTTTHPPLLHSSSAVTLASGSHCTLDPSPLIWLKLYINHTAPLSPLAPRLQAYTHTACQSNVSDKHVTPSSCVTSVLVKLCNCLSKRLSSDEGVMWLKGAWGDISEGDNDVSQVNVTLTICFDASLLSFNI